MTARTPAFSLFSLGLVGSSGVWLWASHLVLLEGVEEAVGVGDGEREGDAGAAVGLCHRDQLVARLPAQPGVHHGVQQLGDQVWDHRRGNCISLALANVYSVVHVV